MNICFNNSTFALLICYLQELEKKAPTEPKDNFDFMHTLGTNSGTKQQMGNLRFPLDSEEDGPLFSDEMEINRNQLTLYEVLGEGAFGLVKRGVYKDIKLDTSYEVAVKMLKGMFGWHLLRCHAPMHIVY